MMHGTIHAQHTPASPAPAHTDLFGEPYPSGELRVPVQVTACLSFAEILGLLTYTAGLDITYADMDDDDYLRDALRFALVMSSHDMIELCAVRAMAVYDGSASSSDSEFVVRLADAVTRTFGVRA